MKKLLILLMAVMMSSTGFCASNTYDILKLNTTSRVIQNGDVIFTNRLVYSNLDYTVSYMGYPKLTLSTNMMASAAQSGGTLVALTNWINALDLSMTSQTKTGTLSSSYHEYKFDLGITNNYTGYFILSISLDSWKDSWSYVKTYFGKYPVNDGLIGLSAPEIVWGIEGNSWLKSGYNLRGRMRCVSKFEGNNIGILFYGTGHYTVYDFSVYAITNGFQGFTGTF